MNKEAFNNLIFILFLIFIILIAGIVFSLSLKLIPLECIFTKLGHCYDVLYSSLINQIILGLIAGLLIFLVIYFILKKGQYGRVTQPVSQKTSFGEIKISIDSIRHLILNVFKGIDEIKEIKPEISILKTSGIKIDLYLAIKQDTNIPEFSEKIQRKVKQHLLETSGVEAKEIKIHINKIFYDEKEK